MTMTTTLTYRGVQYDYVPPAVRTEATDVVAKYRGWNYHCTHAVNPPAQPVRDLIYRGVAYRTNPAAVVNTMSTPNGHTATEVNMPALDLNQLSRVILTHHHQLIKKPRTVPPDTDDCPNGITCSCRSLLEPNSGQN